MTEFVMLVGLPGSGKSAVSQSMKDHLVFSSDLLRKELYGSESFQGNPNTIFLELRNRIKKALDTGESCILDATNLNSKKRKNFLSQLRLSPSVKKTAIVIATSLQKCIENNSIRERTVPEEVIQRMYRQFEFPLATEGWDYIHTNFPFGTEGSEAEHSYLVDKLDDLYNYDQGNEHHSMSLGEHLNICGELWNRKHRHSLKYAGLLHDIGKPQTRTELKANGTNDGNAHYYDHQNTSAYEAMFWLEDMNAFNKETIQLIQMHMLPYFYNNDLEKLKEKAGDLFRLLMELHECDKLAH